MVDDVRPVSDPTSANTRAISSWPAVLAGVSKRSPVGGNFSGPVVTVLRAAFGNVVACRCLGRRIRRGSVGSSEQDWT